MKRFPILPLLAALLCAATTFVNKAEAKPPKAKATKPAAIKPVTVVYVDPAQAANPSRAKRLRLERGARTPATQFLVSTSADRDRYLLLATQRAEGGFDCVNIYDRGILSWGLMQWASHSNSLQDALWYMKGRLADKGKAKLWADLFKKHGLDVQIRTDEQIPTFCVKAAEGGKVVWRPVSGLDNLRVLFRGTKKVSGYDPATVTLWAKVFARAGQDRTMQALQTEWAVRRLQDSLEEKFDGRTVRDFTAGDPFSDALYFSLWTNNPSAARDHFSRAVRQARIVSGEADPKNWPQGLFPFLWEQTGLTSGFPAWPERTRMVSDAVPVGKRGREGANRELASRGWRLPALRGGKATGTHWRRELPPLRVALPTKRLVGEFVLPAPPKPKIKIMTAPKPKPLPKAVSALPTPPKQENSAGQP